MVYHWFRVILEPPGGVVRHDEIIVNHGLKWLIAEIVLPTSR